MDYGFKPLRFEDNYKSYGYYKKTQLSNKQSICIFFLKDRLTFENKYEFSVVLAIADKKKYIKQFLLGQKDLSIFQTGKCGLEGLIWAKKQLLLFEDFVKSISYISKPSILIQWTDNKRKRVYIKALAKYGYKIINKYGWCLYKNIY